MLQIIVLYLCIGFIWSFGLALLTKPDRQNKDEDGDEIAALLLGAIFILWPIMTIAIGAFVCSGLIGLTILKLSNFTKRYIWR